MIRSMTGFGVATCESAAFRASASTRSLNHRFLEINVNMPRDLTDMETEIRGLTQARIRRGRVDVTLRAERIDAPSRLKVSRSAVAALVNGLQDVGRKHAIDATVRASELLLVPGVVESSLEIDADWSDARDHLLDLVRQALDKLDEMRKNEGRRLMRDMREHLDAIDRALAGFGALSDSASTARREQLLAKLAAIREELDLDESRLYQEVARLVDRLDVNEELVRLKSHLSQARDSLDSGEPAGRRLDFLAQEMMREANTIGSKSLSAPMTHAVVEIKTQIERLREQVQNVE